MDYDSDYYPAGTTAAQVGAERGEAKAVSEETDMRQAKVLVRDTSCDRELSAFPWRGTYVPKEELDHLRTVNAALLAALKNLQEMLQGDGVTSEAIRATDCFDAAGAAIAAAEGGDQ